MCLQEKHVCLQILTKHFYALQNGHNDKCAEVKLNFQ